MIVLFIRDVLCTSENLTARTSFKGLQFNIATSVLILREKEYHKHVIF